jgi:hypothetical protein
MNKTNKFSPQFRERVVRLAQDHRGESLSLWAAIELIAPKIGCVLPMPWSTTQTGARITCPFATRSAWQKQTSIRR